VLKVITRPTALRAVGNNSSNETPNVMTVGVEKYGLRISSSY
jgi:hypothetical protein